MTLRDQHVFITGGSSGIGLELGRQAAAAGARVSLIARDLAKLAAARAAIRAAVPGGAEVVTASADVAVEAEILGALQAAEKIHGPVDVLITSAGVARPGHFAEVPVAVFERTMAVNYFGTLYPLKAVVPAMRQREYTVPDGISRIRELKQQLRRLPQRRRVSRIMSHQFRVSVLASGDVDLTWV